MKKILLIDGHPQSDSFISSLCDRYFESAKAGGYEIKRLNVRDLVFDPNLKFGYKEIQQLEPDLIASQQLVLWCDHLVFAYPMWWGAMPALTKGYFDRSWLPGFAFKFQNSSPFWDKLLKGRSARILVTCDAPTIFNLFAYFNSPYTVTKKMIFAFCGFKPIRSTHIGGVKGMSEVKRKMWLNKMSELGSAGG
ncbi:MAG: NAD(P)H-dependent oxidoreductase [Deltaproteobacteria bacterium]|nr:NAD(P)H-dependent oxidoreductase [Deltaproteobacteria bacterium]